MTDKNEQPPVDMVSEQAKQGEKIANIEKSCDEIKECLIGNGKPGLVIRTDRLEQKDKFKSKLFWVITVAVITVFIKTIGIDLISAIAKATT